MNNHPSRPAVIYEVIQLGENQMQNQIFLLTSWLVLILATGCKDTSQIESSVAELKKSVESRLNAIDETLAKMDFDSTNNELQELKKKWGSFQQSFSPEIRQELQKNLDDISRKKKSMEEIRSMAAGLLEQLQQMESESKQLRDQTEQHSIKSKEFDKIGELEKTINTIKFKISLIENDVKRAKQDAASAERKARDAEREARRRR